MLKLQKALSHTARIVVGYKGLHQDLSIVQLYKKSGFASLNQIAAESTLMEIFSITKYEMPLLIFNAVECELSKIQHGRVFE